MSNVEKGFNPQYDDKKESNNIYVGKENKNLNGNKFRKIELIVDQNESFLTEKNKEKGSIAVPFEVNQNNSLILYCSSSDQIKIHCWLIESKDGKGTTGLHISRRTSKGVYGSEEVTLNMVSVILLKKFLDKLFFIDDKNKEAFKIPLTELQCDTNNVFSQIISEEEFNKLIKVNIKNIDTFYKLLSVKKMEESIIKLEKTIAGEYKNEVYIQKFLKENIWMFGNDYGYIVESGKINAQNILDLVPKDFESYIDIIEVKLPKEKLFNYDTSHNNYYSSSDLTKAIAQTQNYIFELENKTKDEEYQKSYECKVVRPKGIILFGSENELREDEKKYLRILNSSFHNLQIITYQQLLEKAKNTIKIANEIN